MKQEEKLKKTATMKSNHRSALLSFMVLVMVAAAFVLGGIANNGKRPETVDRELNSTPVTQKQTPRRASSSTADRMRAGSLCYRNETILFSAAVKSNGKLVCICSSRKFDASEGYLQYRFGRPGKIELEFPKSREDTQSQFRYSRYTRPLVTYLALRFETGGYLYSIHQNHNAEEKPAINEASITVTPVETLDTGPKPVEIRLRAPVKGDLMNLEDMVRRTDEEPTFP